MAKVSKRQVRKAVKTISKAPKGVVFVCFLLVVVLALGYFLYTNFFVKKGGEDYLVYSNVEGEISFHFLTLGNLIPGDCTLVQVGDNDILIDAGSDEDSLDDIKSYLSDKVTDGVLEYVIVTHSDMDHIACFQVDGGIFDSYECEVIIDFPKSTHSETSGSYKDYIEKRNAEILAGAEHYNALDCSKNTNGAKRVYELSPYVDMEILYNYYYDHSTTKNNNNSVCLLFNHEGRKFLFTGDLEHNGEDDLVRENDIGKVCLYKAGHHGSNTSSSKTLLDEIRPDFCIFQTAVGTDKYTSDTANQMPSQKVCDEIKKHTDRVYATSIADREFNGDVEIADLNGNIVVVSKLDRITVYCSNNATKLKDTNWYKERRITTLS